MLWGGTFVAGRLASNQLSPLTNSALRFLIASACFALIMQMRRSWIRPSANSLLYLFLMGLSGVAIYNVCFFAGLKITMASRASLVIATNPVCAMLFAVIFLKEKLTFNKLSGLFLSLAGAVVVITDGNLAAIMNEGFGRGELIIFGCVICWVTYTFLSKVAMKTLPPLNTSSYSTFIGCIILLVIIFSQSSGNEIFQQISSVQITSWLALSYLGIFGTVIAYKLYLDAVIEIGPAKAAQYINLIPFFAVALSAIILNEPITMATLLGGSLIFAGIFLVNRTPLNIASER